ncbi:MAG: SDR family oxidoreductase [Gemmatimonadota bacterium]
MKQGWAVVTGASGGIGEEIARALARRGWNLILSARSREPMELLAQEFHDSHGVEVAVLPRDLARPEGPAQLYREVQGLGHSVEILVNNAGFGDFGSYLELDATRELEMIQLNITTLTDLTRRFAGVMADRGGGRILNVASTAAFQPGPLMTVYYATKAYVLSYSEGLRNELAEHNITVTTLCPGPTRSNFHEAAGVADSFLLKTLPMGESRPVAELGVDAMLAGKGVAIPGLLNRMGALGGRFVPRGWLPAIVRKVQEGRR